MITLFNNNFIEKLKNYHPYKSLLTKITHGEFPAFVEGAKGSLISILIGKLLDDLKESTSREKPATVTISGLVIASTEKEAESIYQDLKEIYQIDTEYFRWWGVLPYNNLAPPQDVERERSRVLTRLSSGERFLIVTSLRALLSKLPPPGLFKKWTFTLSTGNTLNTEKLENQLEKMGYIRVPRVSISGEYSIRGEVIDIYPPASNEKSENTAVRIVLDFDTIEELKYFNPITQQTTKKINSVTISPLKELILPESYKERLKNNLKDCGLKEKTIEGFFERLMTGTVRGELIDYAGLIYEAPATLMDYIPNEFVTFIVDDFLLSSNYKIVEKETYQLYRKRKLEGRDIPPPNKLLFDFKTIASRINNPVIFKTIKTDESSNIEPAEAVKIISEPPQSFFGNITFFKEELSNYLTSGYEIFIFAVYEQQAKRIQYLIRDIPKSQRINIIPSSISSGFALPEMKILVIQENEIFGRKKRIPRSLGKLKTSPIDSFVDLSPDDYVVHMNYGIGIFKGIERIKVLGSERDYIKLEFAESETIFIPVEQANLIQKYIAQDGKTPRLDRIGGKSWENRKSRVKKSVEELASRLIKLYAERKQIKGFAFPPDTEWQNEFEAGFPYRETEDQLRCIEEVKRDMESPYPMDRLVCGDVGYGKTEVALRAAFKAVMGGKQVAVLAPTTILVEQHYETFKERFKNFPVTVEMLSRFKSKAQQNRIVKNLANGKIDIIIGTHRLVQRDIKFKDLGLLVIDEEQRFGVKHKELLKELKTNVDCLTLTATPIPRTLHMSLMKVRDMSLITTPPQNRLPIETIVREFDEEIIREAIMREVERGGQVFYLHNRINTITRVLSLLKRIVPEVTVGVAHGQMDSDELEEIMHSFVRGDFQVLLATSIIENGLDIPNVNTIIIDRADMFGVSQLYQLRGRVGRSDIPAYAYLLYPKDRALSELAMKRLTIISDYTELGSGFKIALKDMEIRGAGNILGKEQHGDIVSVGLDMYIKLLEDSINELQKNREEQPPEPYLELEYSGFIPDDYIREPMEKMEVYKKIASISSEEEFESVYREIEDRFGPLPDEVSNLLSIAEIRIMCKKLFVSSLKEKNGIAKIEFSRLAKISADRVVRLISRSRDSVYLDSKHPEFLYIKTGSIGLRDKADFIKERLSLLLDE